MADAKPKVFDDLTVITGIHFSKAVLRQINSITFIYDPTWNADDYTEPTLPACFFHLKKMNEIMTSEISQKQLLFYNSQKVTDKTAVSGSVLNVVADNIVIKPKMYKLDVLIPYNNISLLSNVVQNTFGTVTMFKELCGSVDGKDFLSTVTPWLSLSQAYSNILKDIIQQFNNVNLTDDWLSGVMGTPDYNKKSLEAMWRSRKILKLKTWDNWTYKYVAIVDMDITKEGTDDGVYEATLTVQEMPIMTVRDGLGKQSFTFKGATKLAGKGMVKTLDTMGSTFGSKWS